MSRDTVEAWPNLGEPKGEPGRARSGASCCTRRGIQVLGRKVRAGSLDEGSTRGVLMAGRTLSGELPTLTRVERKRRACSRGRSGQCRDAAKAKEQHVGGQGGLPVDDKTPGGSKELPGVFVFVMYFHQSQIEVPGCSLLTALNALVFLGRQPPVEPGTDAFEEMIDLVGCRHGSATTIEKAWERFGLETQTGPHTLRWVYDQLSACRPVGISAFSDDFGLHSGLVVGASPPDRTVKVVNWKKRESETVMSWDYIEENVPPYAKNSAVAFTLA